MIENNKLATADGSLTPHGQQMLGAATKALAYMSATEQLPLVLALTDRGKAEPSQQGRYSHIVANASWAYLYKFKDDVRTQWEKPIIKKMKWVLKQKGPKDDYYVKMSKTQALSALGRAHNKSARKIIKKHLRNKNKDIAQAAKSAKESWESAAKRRASK